MATYIIGDIHNSIKKLDKLLSLISPSIQDRVFLLGDLYLLAHAMTFDPGGKEQDETAYLEGLGTMQEYWDHGVDGYISLVGHRDTQYQWKNPRGRYLDEESASIWLNSAENVYMMDCGCGLPGGRLACLCPDTGERFYA